MGDLVKIRTGGSIHSRVGAVGLIIKRARLAIGYPKLNFVKFADGYVARHTDEDLEVISAA